jgi:transposase-like protein
MDHMTAARKQIREEWCPDPVGITEIAKRHGTSPGVIRSWRRRHADFPGPIAELAMGPLFDGNEVDEWIRSTRRGRG